MVAPPVIRIKGEGHQVDFLCDYRGEITFPDDEFLASRYRGKTALVRADYNGYIDMDINLPLPDAEARYVKAYLERRGKRIAKKTSEGTNFRIERR